MLRGRDEIQIFSKDKLMNGTQLCTLNRQVAQDVCDFVYKAQPNEESVTDYLLYRLQEANKTFRYINTQQYTRRQEATTGADYELELWLVGKLVLFHY